MQNHKTLNLPSRILATFMALALAISVTVSPGAAFASAAETATSQTATQAITVALTVVDSTDGTVLRNDTYSSLTEENTVADLLSAAGFTEGTQEESAANPDVYFPSFNAPYFLGKEWDGTNWWSSYSDATEDTYNGAFLDSKLVAGKHYIYTYGTEPFSYTTKVKDPLPTAPVRDASATNSTNSTYSYLLASSNSQRNGFTDESAPYNEYMTTATAALGLMALEGYQAAGTFNVYSPTAQVKPQKTLTKGILERLSAYDSKDLESDFYVTDYATSCMALAAAGLESRINTQLLLDYYAANKDSIGMSAGRIAKLVLGLTAAGLDCTNVVAGGEETDLVAAMAEDALYNEPDLYSLVWMLPVYATYGYADLAADAADTILACQVTEGQYAGLFDSGYGADVQTSAQAIVALATYSQVVDNVSAAVDAIKSFRKSTGAWRETYSSNDNLDTTCAALVALAAAGCDPGTMSPLGIGKITSLSTSSYTYSGKEKRPSVKVTAGCMTLIPGMDYKVSYKNNTKVGTATVTVTGIGDFEGALSKTFKICPKGTSISTVTASSKAFTVKWKKQSTKTTGYQLRYSTKSSMVKAKTVRIASTKTTRKMVTKLKARTKYYVQVRTYTKVNGKYYNSGWSKAKSVKTK